MRQVPTYTIIGSGRLATHFAHYFTLLEISYIQFSSKAFSALTHIPKACEQSHSILLCISDKYIEPYLDAHSYLKEKRTVHFSGGLITDKCYAAHPLMTFADEYYSLETYQAIPFILEEGAVEFKVLFPNLPNLSYAIPKELKTLYHTFCVLSGNFSVLLWQAFFKELTSTFKLPVQTAFPYLNQIFNNLKHQPHNALTGPFARKDLETIERHLNALEYHPMKDIYQAFVKTFVKE